MHDLVTFLSDFGLDDIFVGVCHAVLAERAPHARVIDLTHGVAAGDVELGAALLARAVAHSPVAVHLAVVDPGVGGERRGIAVSAARGDVLVGPDNGLLAEAAGELGGVRSAWELRDPTYRRVPTSATFHGRDVFAPAAAAVASGTDPSRLGPDAGSIATLPDARVETTAQGLVAEVVLVDRFGNVQLAARTADFEAESGDVVGVRAGREEAKARFVRTFAELASGALALYEDSDRRLALAVRDGSAADTLGIGRGATVTLSRFDRGDG